MHQSVAFRLTLMVQELDERELRWDLVRAWGPEIRELLRHFAPAATVAAMDGLRWPPPRFENGSTSDGRGHPVQAQPDPPFNDDDVRAFLNLARAAVLTGSLDAVSRASVEARINMITKELWQAEPRYGVVEVWGRGMRDLLLTVAHPTVVGKLRELSWP